MVSTGSRSGSNSPKVAVKRTRREIVKSCREKEATQSKRMCKNWDIVMIIFLIKELHKMVMKKVKEAGETNNVQFTNTEWGCLASKVNNKRFKCGTIVFTAVSISNKVQNLKNGCSDMLSLLESDTMKSERKMWKDITDYTRKRSVAPSSSHTSRTFSFRSPQCSGTSTMHRSTSGTKSNKQPAPLDSNTAELNKSDFIKMYDKVYAVLHVMDLEDTMLAKAIEFLNAKRDIDWMHIFLLLELDPYQQLTFLETALLKFDQLDPCQ